LIDSKGALFLCIEYAEKTWNYRHGILLKWNYNLGSSQIELSNADGKMECRLRAENTSNGSSESV
jgi:hypothetical protein